MTIKIGTKIDRMARQQEKIDAQRKMVQKEEEKLKKLKAKYTEMENELIESLPAENINGAVGKLKRAELITDDIPTVDDWNKFYSYMLKNKSVELLQKRISRTAINELLADGKKVPGIKIFHKKRISLRKI